MTTPTKPRPGFLKRFLRRALVCATLLALAVAFAPWLASVGAVRSMILAQVNHTYAPTHLEVAQVSASWFRPTQLTGLTMKDRDGKAVVTAPSGVLNRNLLQLLFSRPDYGTLTLHRATVDIERHPDGRIDLWDALEPLLRSDPNHPSDPRTDFTLAISEGTLRVASPELAEPIAASRLDMTLHASPAPGPLSWDITLGSPSGDDASKAALHLAGTLDHRAPGSPLKLEVNGDTWPVAVGTSGLALTGAYSGSITVSRDDQQLTLSGDTALDSATASGPLLQGDTPDLGRVLANVALTKTADSLRVDRLKVESRLAHVELSAPEKLDSTHATARIDLAELARQLPHAIRLREGLTVEQGSVTATFDLDQVESGGQSVALAAELRDLAAFESGRRIAISDPITLHAKLKRADGDVSVEDATITSPFLQAQGHGDLRQGVTVKGSADLGQLEARARQFLDLGSVSLQGRARFLADARRDDKSPTPAFTARLAVESEQLHLAGLTEAPISRPVARVDVAVQGPLSDTGSPAGWSKAWFTLKSAPTEAKLHLVRAADDSMTVQVRASSTLTDIASLAGSSLEVRGLRNSAVVAEIDGQYVAASDRLDVSRLLLDAGYLRLDGQGHFSEATTRLVADASGTLSPNYPLMQELLAAQVGSPAVLSGQPRAFRLRGPLRGDSLSATLAGLDADLGLDLTGADLAGLSFGPATLAFQCRNGQILIPPISTTLNGGNVELRPGLELRPDGSAFILLGQGTAIDRAQINEELSRQVLSYIAPVLHEATQVSGQVSAAFDHAAIPIAGASSSTSADLAAQVTFHQVTYGPGPLAQQILAISGMQQVPSLTIDQAVDVTITQGRVAQSGLSIAVAPGIDLALDGSVGLDSTLALRAGVPLSARLLGNQKQLSEIVGGTKVALPIGGTLSRPSFDRSAFQVGLRQTAGSLLDKAASRGVSELLKQLGGDSRLPDAASPSQPLSTGETLEGLGRGLLKELLPR